MVKIAPNIHPVCRVNIIMRILRFLFQYHSPFREGPPSWNVVRSSQTRSALHLSRQANPSWMAWKV